MELQIQDAIYLKSHAVDSKLEGLFYFILFLQTILLDSDFVNVKMNMKPPLFGVNLNAFMLHDCCFN